MPADWRLDFEMLPDSLFSSYTRTQSNFSVPPPFILSPLADDNSEVRLRLHISDLVELGSRIRAKRATYQLQFGNSDVNGCSYDSLIKSCLEKFWNWAWKDTLSQACLSQKISAQISGQDFLNIIVSSTGRLAADSEAHDKLICDQIQSHADKIYRAKYLQLPPTPPASQTSEESDQLLNVRIPTLFTFVILGARILVLAMACQPLAKVRLVLVADFIDANADAQNALSLALCVLAAKDELRERSGIMEKV